jgi:hypothetical protein
MSNKTKSNSSKPFTNDQIDAIIGRPTISEEFSNKEKLFFYHRFEEFVLKALEGQVNKNDIVRAWNLMTRKPLGHSNTKRLLFQHLNLIEYTLSLPFHYSQMGKKIDEKTEAYEPYEHSKLINAVECIDKILALFMKPWHYKVTLYHSGIMLWINNKANKIIMHETRPSNMVYYYTSNSKLGGTSMYQTAYSRRNIGFFD